MRLEIRDPRDRLGTRIGRADGERVGVVEPQWHACCKLMLGELRIQFGQWWNRVELEDLACNRACVLGIDIDAARLERVLQDPGVAESALMCNLGPGAARRLRHDFTE